MVETSSSTHSHRLIHGSPATDDLHGDEAGSNSSCNEMVKVPTSLISKIQDWNKQRFC